MPSRHKHTAPPHNLSDSEGVQRLQDEWDEAMSQIPPEKRREMIRAAANLKPATGPAPKQG